MTQLWSQEKNESDTGPQDASKSAEPEPSLSHGCRPSVANMTRRAARSMKIFAQGCDFFGSLGLCASPTAGASTIAGKLQLPQPHDLAKRR